MAYSDFDIFATSTAAMVPSTSSPIVGTRSLLATTPGGLAGVYALPKTTSSMTQGLTKGRMRVVVKGSYSNSIRMGMMCMMSQRDVRTGTTGVSFYKLTFIGTTVNIYKHLNTNFTASAGSSTVGSFALSSFPGGTPSGSTPWAFELMWFYDLNEYAGVRFEFKYGTATDFSNLSAVFNATDTTSPLSTSVSEGIVTENFGGGGAASHTYDSLTLYSVDFA